MGIEQGGGANGGASEGAPDAEAEKFNEMVSKDDLSPTEMSDTSRIGKKQLRKISRLKKIQKELTNYTEKHFEFTNEPAVNKDILICH